MDLPRNTSLETNTFMYVFRFRCTFGVHRLMSINFIAVLILWCASFMFADLGQIQITYLHGWVG